MSFAGNLRYPQKSEESRFYRPLLRRDGEMVCKF